MIEDVMINVIMMDKITESDGMGGTDTLWKEGAPFKAAISTDTSTEAQIAGKQGVTSFYTVVVKNNVSLRHDDVFKRVEDGQVFRITTLKKDGEAPKGSIPYIQYKAELHELV